MTERDLIGREGMERRRFLKSAATVAWAAPAILTLTANRAGAQSCVPQGAPCDACPTGINCCIAGTDPLPCCCSDPNDVTTCDGVCRGQAACQAIYPGGPTSDPDACFYPGGTGSSASMARSTATRRKYKTLRL